MLGWVLAAAGIVATAVFAYAWRRAENEIQRLRRNLIAGREHSQELSQQLVSAGQQLEAARAECDDLERELADLTASMSDGEKGALKRIQSLENELAHRRQLEGARKL